MIHNSHPRKELIEIVELFQIFQVKDYKDLKKADLSKELWYVLTKSEYIRADQEHYFVDNIHELREYLMKPHNKQIPNDVVREDVISRAKNLLFYAKTGYDFTGSNYDNIEEVMADMLFVKNYGDLPAVRRAIRLVNEDLKVPHKVEPTLTRRCEKKLQREKKIKSDTTLRFRLSYDPVVLIFD
jgi:hypothetical protein